ncbi:MAG: A24 family peptidase [Clostridiales bacterium]|nr:A24 family peptidase [Clostridiales bacterium]
MILHIVRGILLAGFLLYGSIHDIRTHTMPDWVWMGVAETALLGMKLSALPSMLLGAAAVLLIEVPLAVLLKDRAIGGADIKLSAAGAFLLGWQKGLAALILGLTLSLIIVPIVRRIRHEDNRKAFPLVPFLAAGIMTAALI